MPIDSTADLLFRIGANTDDGEENIQRFRALLSKDLGDLGAEFSDWSTKVFGDLTTVTGALTALTAASAAGVVALVAGAVEMAHTYSEYVEEVERGSRATGISTEAMSGLHLMAEETGVSYDSLVHGLTRFASTITKATEGGGEQMKMFHALGISQEQVKAGQKDMLPLLELVMDRFHKLGPSVASSAAAREEFGRGGAELLRMLGMGGEALQHYIEKTKEMGIAVHATDVEAVEQFNATTRVTKSELTALALEIGQRVLPVINNLMVGVIAAGIALKNLPHLASGFGSFVANFTLDMQALGKEVNALAANAANLAKTGDGLDPGGKAPKTLETFRGISELLDEIQRKEADLGGPMAKAAAEGEQLRDRLEEARQRLEQLHAEGKLSARDYEMQLQDMRIAAVIIPGLIAQMTKKAGDAVAASVRETGQQLQQELLKQGPQTLAIKQAEWTAEIAARREKLIEKGKAEGADETANLALLDEIEIAGHRKIADDALRERLRGDAELQSKLAALGEQGFAARRAQAQRDYETERREYAEKGQLDAEAEAKIAAVRKATLDKIAADEKAANDAEMARLGEQLERIDREHQTAAQRIAAQYAADVAKYSAAEEKKTIAAATGEAERTRIAKEFAAIRAGLLLKEQQDLQQLRNSQGWQGVFGQAFAQAIRGNEALSKEWQTTQNQSQMLVRVALESTKEEAEEAFGKMAEGMGAAIAQGIAYEKNIGKAMEAALKSTLASLSAQAFAQALYSTALGFIDLAEGDPVSAALAFEAAGYFALVGAVSGFSARAIPGGGSGASAGSGSAGTGPGASGQAGAAGSSAGSAYGTAAGTSGPHVTVNVYGHVYGTSGVAEFAGMLNDAVLNQGVTLTATNTTTGKQVQQ